MYITQILEQKWRGIAFFILLVPYEQLKLIFFSPQVGLEQGISWAESSDGDHYTMLPPPPTATAYC